MKIYKIGKVISGSKTYLILESNYLGEIIYVSNPGAFEKDKVQKIFIFEYKTDYTNNTFGFKTFEERLFFTHLISVPSIGPKTALGILKENSKDVMNWIASGNVRRLSEVPLVGNSGAQKIIIALQDKYSKYVDKTSNNNIYDIKDSLKILGFNKKQIQYAIDNVKPNNNIEIMVEEAIKVISNAKNIETQ